MQQYDYIIIGAGAAGLNIAIRFATDSYFSDHRILIIDKDDKVTNDRTWSFWEKGPSKRDKFVTKQWTKGVFYSDEKKHELFIYPYIYKTVRSSDFYDYARTIISKAKHITWSKEKVQSIDEGNVTCTDHCYSAGHIFDSRVSDDFSQNSHKYSSLIQHFKGWFIKTDQKVFDPDEFIMMDYRLRWQDQTSFTYVLPFTENYALVEFTLFNQKLLTDEEYDLMLKTYIKDFLKIDTYEIVEVEQGTIPMTDYPFHKGHSEFVTKIGTAGGWVKPSSGYSFRNANRQSKKIIDNLKNGKIPYEGIIKKRFRKYDSTLLDVLCRKNELGAYIFETLYTKHPMPTIFEFLDEKSSLIDEVRIMNSLNLPEFRKAFFKKLFKKA